MAETVRVEYVLSDRISRKLEKIQKQALKTEAALASIDGRLEKLSKPATANKFAQNWQKSFAKINRAAGAHTKKLDGLATSTEKWGKAANKSRQELRFTRDTLKSLDRHVNTSTRSLDKQARIMKMHSDETAQAANHMFAFSDAEKSVTKAMSGKNREALRQRKHMRGLAADTNRAARASRGMSKGMREFRDIIKEVQDYSFFRDGFRSGATMFQTFTKLLGIMPVLATGLGGIGNAINAIATGAVTLSASLGRLAGSMGALGGLYASLGIAAGVGKGTMNSLFKPMVENADKIKELDKQIKTAQRSLSASRATAAKQGQARADSVARARLGVTSAENRLSTGTATQGERDGLARAQLSYSQALARTATSGAAAANTEDRLNSLIEERAKLLNKTNARADEFNANLDYLKANWQNLMSGDANANIDHALATFTSLNSVIDAMRNPVKDVQAAIRGLVTKGTGILTNPGNQKLMAQSFGESATAVNIIGDIMERVAPLFLRVVVASQKFANRILKSVDGWLAAKEASGELLEFADKIESYYGRSEKSLHRWASILKNVGGAFANIFRAAAPVTNQFESDLESVTSNFKKWTANSGNFARMEVFFDQTYRVLQGVGRLAVSILTMFGNASGGGDAGKSKAIADSMVQFLDQLGAGLERFGKYAGDSLTTVGPALNRFFTELGKVAGAANLTGVVTDVLDTITKILGVFNSFTDATGTGSFLNFLLEMRIRLLALGFITGSIVGPFARFVGIFGRFANLVTKGGLASKMGSLASKIPGAGMLGKGGAALAMATAQPVFVTNWPMGMGGPMDVLGGGKKGRLGAGAAGAGLAAKTPGLRMGYGMLRAGGAGRAAAAAGSLANVSKAVGPLAKTIGKVALPVTVAVGAFGALNEGLQDSNGKLSAMGSASKGFLKAIDPTSLIPGFDGLANKLPQSGAEMDKYNKKLEESTDALSQYNAGVRELYAEGQRIRKEQGGAVNKLAGKHNLKTQGGKDAFTQSLMNAGMSQSDAVNVLNNKIAQDKERAAKRNAALRSASGLTATLGVGGSAHRVGVVSKAGAADLNAKMKAAGSMYAPATMTQSDYKKARAKDAPAMAAAKVSAPEAQAVVALEQQLSDLRKTRADYAKEWQPIIDQTSKEAGKVPPILNDQLGVKSVTEIDKATKAQGTSLDAMLSQTATKGGGIATATEGWSKRVNDALAGVKNPAATTSGGAGSPTQAPTQGLPNLLGPQFAKGGVIGGDPRRGDVVPIMAAGGEVILNEEQQQKVGKGNIQSALMSSTSKHHKSFGTTGRAREFAEGGTVNPFTKLESMFGLQRSSGDHDAPGVHASGSYHYRPAPWGGVQAYDYGDARNSVGSLTNAANYGVANASLFAESFYDKIGSYVKNGNTVPGQFGGHGDHWHAAISAQGAFPGSSNIASPMGGAAQLPAVPNFGGSLMGRKTTAAVTGKRNNLMAAMNTAANPATVDASGVKGFAQQMLPQYGWGPEQFGPLDQLWTKESGWRWNADNPTSDAYGIPQALPGSKMSSAGPDWQTNPATQIKWGLGYIKGRYGNPAQAWAHSVANNWYGNGGNFVANGPQTIGVGENGPERVSVKPLSAGGTRNRNGSGNNGSGNTFNTNISVGVLVGNEDAMRQLTEMVGERMADDFRKAQAVTVNGSDDF